MAASFGALKSSMRSQVGGITLNRFSEVAGNQKKAAQVRRFVMARDPILLFPGWTEMAAWGFTNHDVLIELAGGR